MKDPEVQKHLSGVGVSWQFNVERALGGVGCSSE